MADDEAEEDLEAEGGEDGDEEEEGEGSPKKQGSKTKLLLFVALALFLVVGGAAAAYFTGLLEPLIAMLGGADETAAEETTDPVEAIFFDLPEILVNLNTGGRKSTFLKIRVSLELENAEDVARIEAVMPRIIDNFQVYLRELRVEDLKGSAGMYRLREELLTRVILAAAPSKVSDVLFKEMLVQ
ncbi:MAG: flagellar basal body-associated FliL family protein [Proteobacteria bacterium]|nr:flagellar basal body-associated FliL family protein [Pseudomonadota bacterium]